MNSTLPRPSIHGAVAAVAVAVIVAACTGLTSSSAAPAAVSPSIRSTAAPTSASIIASPASQSGGQPGSTDGQVDQDQSDAKVHYASASASQVLDLWKPVDAVAPVPLIIFVHGGAFVAGDRSMEDQYIAPVLAAGYAAASLDYRLSGEAPFPAAVQDVKAAVRFLRANAARYGLDPDRFAAWGQSAGGYLATMIGTTGDQATVFDDPSLGNAGVSSAVQGVVDLSGPTDFLQLDAQFASVTPAACNGVVPAYDPADSPVSLFLGAPLQAVPDRAAAADPITYIATAKKLPAFFIAHGDSDCQVPHQQSQILHEALRAAGATSTFTLVAGAGHDESVFTGQAPIALEMLKSVFGK